LSLLFILWDIYLLYIVVVVVYPVRHLFTVYCCCCLSCETSIYFTLLLLIDIYWHVWIIYRVFILISDQSIGCIYWVFIVVCQQPACPWSAHKDNWSPWSYSWCVQEEGVNNFARRRTELLRSYSVAYHLSIREHELYCYTIEFCWSNCCCIIRATFYYTYTGLWIEFVLFLSLISFFKCPYRCLRMLPGLSSEKILNTWNLLCGDFQALVAGIQNESKFSSVISIWCIYWYVKM